MSNRTLKLNSLIKDLLGEILFKEIEPKDFGLITIIDVETSPDLTSCKVWVSSINNQDQLIEALYKDIYYVQQILNKKLTLRRVPKIIFKLDKGGLHAEKIDKILLGESKHPD